MLVQGVWKNGVKVNGNECGIVEREEFERCIEITTGYDEEWEELIKNVKKWRDLAKKTLKENSSSDVNLKDFSKEFLLGCNEFTDYSDYFKNCSSKNKIIELPRLPPLSSIDFSSFVFDDVESNNWAVEFRTGKLRY
ncbi:hypothetical protein H5410_037282 [Solanum commersonii]|uniref:Uncharacterized protein n=1 Tax=Solanum commersonii TaxID=4109 RepID=A0A9J5Y7K4_SOLCO|nr:hypothetical protein H5410_037282 [Solanum commersonii]